MTRTTRRKLTIGAIIDEIEEEESEDIACKGYFKVFLELEKNSNWIYIYKEPERTGLEVRVRCQAMETSQLARWCSMGC